MYREPSFMRDLHKRQAREYERTKLLSLHEFVNSIEEKAKRVLISWGLREKALNKNTKKISPIAK